MNSALIHLLHLLIQGHRQKPWCIDLDGNPVGCMTCRKERIMRAIKRPVRRPGGPGW